MPAYDYTILPAAAVQGEADCRPNRRSRFFLIGTVRLGVELIPIGANRDFANPKPADR